MSGKYPGGFVTAGAPAGFSVAFDGTGDYLNASPTALGSGNFTIECWAYLTTSVASKGIFHVATSSVLPSTVTGVALASGASGGWTLYYNNASQNTNTTLTASLNTWIHLAVVKNGTTIYVYVNGVLNQSQTDTANYTNTSAAIGGFFSTSFLMTGNISNFRIVVGSALYSGTSTTAANFNLPAQLFNVSGTALLTCNSPAIIDQGTANSGSGFPITVNGDAKVSNFTPFTGYTAGASGFNPALGAAAPGIWTLDEATNYQATRAWPIYDPYFNQTVLMLRTSSTDGLQNNTFLDSSSNGFTITRNPAAGPNAPTQGTFTPFSQTGWSTFFNGTSSFNVASNAAFALGTGDFTIEFWLYPTTATGQRNIVFPTTGAPVVYMNASSQLQLDNFGTTPSVTTTNILTLNAWNHCAVCRVSGTVNLYINGVSGVTTTAFSATSFVQSAVNIGTDNGTNFTNGYMTNVRIIKGASAYTSNFTPSTAPLTAVAGTSLLTCQSNRFVDNGTANAGSGFSFTFNGTPRIQAFSPFAPTVAYDAVVVGGSGYFDGTGDYLVTSGSALNTGAGTADVTFECWVYNNGFSGSQFGRGIFTFYPSATYASNRLMVRLSDTSNLLNCYFAVGGVAQFGAGGTNSTASITPNAWTHIAIVRSSQTFYIYINGVRDTTLPATTASLNTFDKFDIGRTQDGTVPEFNGLISNFRYLKGTAQYTGTTYPIPTAPFTPITNTQLLLNFTNAGIFDSTAKNVLETVGNAQASIAQKKYGPTAMYFDGTGDYLYLPTTNPLFAFQNARFTIEAWIFMAGGDLTIRGIYGTRGTANAAVGVTLSVTAANKLAFEIGNNATVNAITGTTSLVLNTWYHVAAVLSGSGNTITIYINGVSDGTGSRTVGAVTLSQYVIGRYWIDSNSNYFNGYIDDFRITTGVARYINKFTPPTSQLQDQ